MSLTFGERKWTLLVEASYVDVKDPAAKWANGPNLAWQSLTGSSIFCWARLVWKPRYLGIKISMANHGGGMRIGKLDHRQWSRSRDVQLAPASRHPFFFCISYQTRFA